tara:strand:+ start:2940 stop:4613 length:1674 start_codon:yes stop_codon:yes gene_type:complete
MKKLYFLFLFISSLGLAQSPGDLVITEIMQNPAGVSDDFGEWVEVYNTTASDIDLINWILRDQPGSSQNIATISTSIIVPAGGYISLGRGGDTDPDSAAYNGGFTHDYVYDSNFLMSNGSDEVILEAPNGTVIDEVYYDNGSTYPDPSGSSMQLDAGSFNSTANDTGSNWCEGTDVYGSVNGIEDKGTPGALNNACAPVCEASLDSHTADCDAITSGTDTYTVTLAFSGTGASTFEVSATLGTVSGDNPSTNATGNITVSGIPEGTGVTITMDDTATGGLCNLTRSVTSPVCEATGSIDLEIQGVIDFGLASSNGKAVHLVASSDISDLSVYGIGVANNGGGSDGQEYSFDVLSVSAGDHILVARSLTEMESYLTTEGYNLFAHTLVASSSISQNGDDAIELYKNGVVVETFGDIYCDPNAGGSACTEWEYTDSWAYKSTTAAIWPTGWIYGAVGCAVNATTFDSTCVYPFVSSLSADASVLNVINVHPNPVSNGFLTINTQASGPKNINLYDINGRTVLSTQLESNVLDVSAVKSGFYLLSVDVNGTSLTHKLFIK